MAKTKTVLVIVSFIYVFSCSILCLESGGTKCKRVKTIKNSTSTLIPNLFSKKNATFSPNLLVFGPEFQVTKPKITKTLVKNKILKNEKNFVPKIMIFEPDRLFWPFNVETDVVPPFVMMRYQPTTKRRRTKNSPFTSPSGNVQLIDRNKTILQTYPNLVEIFAKLQKKGIKIAVAETSPEIATIRHLLHLFDLDYMFAHMAIDLDSAVDHVKEIKKDSGIEFSDLVYFGFNKSILNEIKWELKVLTIHVNRDEGLDVMHIYKAIYLYNIRPLLAVVKGKPNFMNELLPDELVEENTATTKQPVKHKTSRKPRTRRVRKLTGNSTTKPVTKYPRTRRKPQ